MTGHPDRTRPLVVIDGRDGGSLAVHVSADGHHVFLLDDGDGNMVRRVFDTADVLRLVATLHDLLATPLGRDLLDMDGDTT